MPQATDNQFKGSKPGRRKFRLGSLVLLPLLLLLVFISAAFTTNLIPSGSMEPTLTPGDEIAVERVWAAYPFGSMPARGDVITFHLTPSRQIQDDVNNGVQVSSALSASKGVPQSLHPILLIKRVIGLPGDKVQLIGNTVYINGRPMPQFYQTIPTHQSPLLFPYAVQTPITVPAGRIFVLGDNRDNSDDGRFWGTLARNQIVGRYLFVLTHRRIPGASQSTSDPTQ